LAGWVAADEDDGESRLSTVLGDNLGDLLFDFRLDRVSD
jgi:hypothetical protein